MAGTTRQPVAPKEEHKATSTVKVGEKVVPLAQAQKMILRDDEAMEIFQIWSDRNGRFTQDQIHRVAWEKNELPLYRGIPRMLPFELKIDRVAFDFTSFVIMVEYHFSDRRA